MELISRRRRRLCCCCCAEAGAQFIISAAMLARRPFGRPPKDKISIRLNSSQPAAGKLAKGWRPTRARVMSVAPLYGVLIASARARAELTLADGASLTKALCCCRKAGGEFLGLLFTQRHNNGARRRRNKPTKREEQTKGQPFRAFERLSLARSARRCRMRLAKGCSRRLASVRRALECWRIACQNILYLLSHARAQTDGRLAVINRRSVRPQRQQKQQQRERALAAKWCSIWTRSPSSGAQTEQRANAELAE